MVRLKVTDQSFAFGREAPQVLLMILDDYSPFETALQMIYRAIECKGKQKPCRKCDVCTLLSWKPSSEINYFASEQGLPKEAVLKIKEAAESSGDAGGAARIFVITGIEHMSPQAANSLLKFLEQTSPGVFFVLATRNLGAVLPTVVSRSTVLWLLPDFQAFKEEVSALASGNDLDVLLNACSDVNQVRRLLEDPAYGTFVEACQLMNGYRAGRTARLVLINALKALSYPHQALCRRYMVNKFKQSGETVSLMTSLDRKPLKVIVADEIVDSLEVR